MRYRVLVSNGNDSTSFYSDTKEYADLLFNMAVNSGMFTYVELADVIDECFVRKEWSADDE